MHQPGHPSASTKTPDGLTREHPVPDAEQRRGSGQPVRHHYLDHLAVRQDRPRIRWPQPVDDPRGVQPTQKLGSDRHSAQALGHHGPIDDLHARAFRPPGRHSGPYETVLNQAVGCGDCGSGKGGRARPDSSATAANPKAPAPALPTQGGANLEDRQRPPGFQPLRSGQAVLRPPGDLADRARPARESDRRSDRTGRWSVAPTALDPLPPRTPQPTRTGPGG